MKTPRVQARGCSGPRGWEGGGGSETAQGAVSVWSSEHVELRDEQENRWLVHLAAREPPGGALAARR